VMVIIVYRKGDGLIRPRRGSIVTIRLGQG
jgi:hypothetical protein